MVEEGEGACTVYTGDVLPENAVLKRNGLYEYGGCGRTQGGSGGNSQLVDFKSPTDKLVGSRQWTGKGPVPRRVMGNRRRGQRETVS